MTRQVLCLSAGVVARPIDEAKCSSATKPQSHKVCNTKDCVTSLYPIYREGEDYYWRLMIWTPVGFDAVVVVVVDDVVIVQLLMLPCDRHVISRFQVR